MYVPPRKRLHLELHLSAKVKLIKEARTTPKPIQKFVSSNYAVGASTVSDILKRLMSYLDNMKTMVMAKRNDLIMRANLMSSTN